MLAHAEEPTFLELEPVDLEALTVELHTKLEAIAPRRWEIESLGTGVIVADRQRLTQAVAQLAENAAKHTDEGDRIGLGTSNADGSVRLWVTESGPGIPAEEQQRLFERFARLGNGRRTDGIRLGLSIVQAIARAHGGGVEVRSAVGEGATFTLVVPLGGPRERL